MRAYRRRLIYLYKANFVFHQDRMSPQAIADSYCHHEPVFIRAGLEALNGSTEEKSSRRHAGKKLKPERIRQSRTRECRTHQPKPSYQSYAYHRILQLHRGFGPTSRQESEHYEKPSNRYAEHITSNNVRSSVVFDMSFLVFDSMLV